MTLTLALVSERVPTLIAASLPLASQLVVFGGTGQWERLLDEPRVLAFQILWAVLPFLVLVFVASAVPRVRRNVGIASWTGLVLSASVWVWITVDGYRYQNAPDGSGANIGLGMLMLALPIVVGGLMIALALVRRTPPDRAESR